MFSTKDDFKKNSNNNKTNGKDKIQGDNKSDSNDNSINVNNLEQNVPMKICGKESDNETYYCYNNVVNMGENFMMRLTTLRACDRNKDKNDKNLYCKYYEECVKPNDS